MDGFDHLNQHFVENKKKFGFLITCEYEIREEIGISGTLVCESL